MADPDSVKTNAPPAATDGSQTYREPELPSFQRSRLRSAFGFAIRGFVSAVKTERNLQIHLFVAAVVVACGLFFRVTLLEWALLAIVISLVISAELFNTALERTLDRISPEYHPLTGQAKDVAAAAVLTLSLGAVAVGLIIFLPYTWELLSAG